MTLDEAIADVSNCITGVSPDAVLRVVRHSEEEASIRAYAGADKGDAIKDATRDKTHNLLINDGIDVQVIFYDIATSLPPEE